FAGYQSSSSTCVCTDAAAFFVFFFFQAEDGIRDFHVTGVQTCALPIFQVLDISLLNAPYHIGYIKPNGFTRDVVVQGRFAFIAASHEGVVVADIADPALPIVAKVDTLGVANRLHLQGNLLYVADMSGDGGASQLNVVDISDPYQPKVTRTVDIKPARKDLHSRGVYDVTLTGNLAYVTVAYSDQEDQPAQALVEIIDLEKALDPTWDATLPVMVHRQATDGKAAARGVTLARGAMHVATGQAGIGRIELTELTVLDHSPAFAETEVSTGLESIHLVLSAPLPANAELAQSVQVIEGDPLIGEEISSQFSIRFGERNGEPHHSRLELVPVEGFQLRENTQYFVRVKAGLAPLTGQPLAQDYQFALVTSAAGSALAPDITQICALTALQNQGACTAVGGVEGGTELVIRGHHFSERPTLTIGGQPVVVERVEAADEADPYDRLYAKTIPNYA